MSEVAETLYVMINKASSEKEQVTTEETTAVEEKENLTTEETTQEAKEEATQEAKEEAKPVEEDSSEDQTCADEECKCHDPEEDSSEDSKETSEEDGSDDEKPIPHVIRVETQFEYFPASINAFAMLVLFLHFLNALLQLSDRNQNRLECFKRPY